MADAYNCFDDFAKSCNSGFKYSGMEYSSIRSSICMVCRHRYDNLDYHAFKGQTEYGVTRSGLCCQECCNTILNNYPSVQKVEINCISCGADSNKTYCYHCEIDIEEELQEFIKNSGHRFKHDYM